MTMYDWCMGRPDRESGGEACGPVLEAEASGGREPCVRACPYSSVDMRVGASTQPQGTLDEGTFRQRYGETVHHRTIEHAKIVGGI